MKVTWMTRQESHAVVLGKMVQTEVVLDIGPGIRPQAYFRPRVHICVEPYLPYIERLRQDTGGDAAYVFLNGTWDSAMKFLPERSVDTVFALDVLEHFEKEDGRRFLEEAARVARCQVIVFTPLGLYPQAYDESNNQDRWGMEGAYWQAHRSGWYPEDFEEEWELLCCKEYHFVDEHEHALKVPFGAIWAFRNLDGQAKRSPGISRGNREELFDKTKGKYDSNDGDRRQKELIRGEELFSQGALEAAKECFLKLVSGSDPCKEAFNNLGVIAYREGKCDDAIHYFTESLLIDPLNEDALANLTELRDAIKKARPDTRITVNEPPGTGMTPDSEARMTRSSAVTI